MRMKKNRPKIKTSFKETTSMDALSASKTILLRACLLKKETHLNKSLVITQTKNRTKEVESTVEEFP
jgi:cytolysin (calcineurin-like family phosphatase)